MVSALLTPPGRAKLGWMRRPPTKRIISWPNFLKATALSANWGFAWIKPTTLRIAGSASKPKRKSGPASSKKCIPWLWIIWPLCIKFLSRDAGRGGVTPKIWSAALAEAKWWLTGQIPQMRGVISGISKTMRPSQNFSNPRNSLICKYAWSTFPVSFKLIVILAWPSILVTGSIVIFCVAINPLFLIPH